MGALAENMPGARWGPMPVGWTSVKYMRHCFHRAATISAPMKVSRLSRFPVSLLPNSTSVWSTPSIGRSLGILLPMRRAKVGKKSIVENIAYEVVSGLTLPGQRTKQNVLIEPSVASPSSPRNGPELPMSGDPWLPISRAVSPWGPLSEAKTRRVLSSTPSSFNDLTDVIIAFHELVAILTDPRLARELLRRQVRKMPHRERQVEEEGFPSRCLPLHEFDGLRHQFGIDLGADFPRVGLDCAQWTARDGLDDLRPLRQQFFGRRVA